MKSFIKQTGTRNRAAAVVAGNWRIRCRLPQITAYAKLHGFIQDIQPICHIGQQFVHEETGQVGQVVSTEVIECRSIPAYQRATVWFAGPGRMCQMEAAAANIYRNLKPLA